MSWRKRELYLRGNNVQTAWSTLSSGQRVEHITAHNSFAPAGDERALVERRKLVLAVKEAQRAALWHTHTHKLARDKEGGLAAIVVVVEVEQQREL